MKNLIWFVISVLVVEVISLIALAKSSPTWVYAIVILGVLIALVFAFRGWVKQRRLQIEPIKQGKVIRKRHWGLFNG